MEQTALKDQYIINKLDEETLVFFSYSGYRKYDKHPVKIWAFKSEYLTAHMVRRFIRICEQLMTVSSPHLLPLIDHYYDGEQFYTVYKWGQTTQSLESYLIKNKSIKLDQVNVFRDQVLIALETLEKQSLIAGNLSLQTLFIEKNQLKLGNIVLPTLIYQRHFSQFSMIDDCIFFPPEFLYNQETSSCSDVYSVGVLLVFFYTQKWPYEYTASLNQLKKELASLGKVPPVVKMIKNPVLRHVVEQCIQCDAVNRIQSIQHLRQMIENQMPSPQTSISPDNIIQKKLKEQIKKKQYGVLAKGARLALIVGGMSLTIYLIYWTGMGYLTAIPQVVVPDIVGKSIKDAKVLLRQSQLKMTIVDERIHPVIPAGHILESKPPSGREVKQNRVIRVFVSKGVPKVLVPNVIGKTIDQANILFQEDGRKIDVLDSEYSFKYPKGMIINQQPSANTVLEQDQPVGVIVSKGFPVTMSKKPVDDYLVEDTKMMITIKFQMLEEWPDIEVTVVNISNGESSEVYKEVHYSGDSQSLSFELLEKSYLEVYFNDEQVLKAQV